MASGHLGDLAGNGRTDPGASRPEVGPRLAVGEARWEGRCAGHSSTEHNIRGHVMLARWE